MALKGWQHDHPGEALRRLSNEIAYLTLSSVKAADATDYILKATGAKCLVIDIRNYPSEYIVFALGQHLVSRRSEFARFTAVREANGRQTNLLQEMLGGITQLQLLGAEGRVMRRYVRLSLTTVRHEIGLRKNELAFTLVSMCIVGLGIALIVGYTGVRVILGGLTVGGLVAFYGYVSTVLLPIGTAASLSGQLIRVRVSIDRVIELEQAQDVIQDAPAAEPLPSCPRAVVCRDVSLDYGAGTQALRRVHFRAHAGECVAVVGVSGSGKSSLLRLIPRGCTNRGRGPC